MDYKEKYEQALSRAKQFSEKPLLEDSAGIVEYIFPELKEPELVESENERIRKEILLFLREGKPYYCPNSIKRQEWAAWLEKQSEQNSNCIRITQNIITYIN